jgi:hypothetical protein
VHEVRAMGKAAENERLKLHATFCNNLAVGILITVMVVPIFALYSSPYAEMPVSKTALKDFYYPVLGVVVGVSLAISLRMVALSFLRRIKG